MNFNGVEKTHIETFKKIYLSDDQFCEYLDNMDFQSCYDMMRSVYRYVLTYMLLQNGVDPVSTLNDIKSGYGRSCQLIKNVQTSPSLTNIGLQAFDSSNIESISFHEDAPLDIIDKYAFYNTKNLKKKVILPKKVRIIRDDAFAYSGIQSIDLGSNIDAIGYDAFLGCDDLEEVIMPSTVKLISEGAFDMCNKLNKIVYNGTRREWDAINIGFDAIPPHTRIVCIDD